MQRVSSRVLTIHLQLVSPPKTITRYLETSITPGGKTPKTIPIPISFNCNFIRDKSRISGRNLVEFFVAPTPTKGKAPSAIPTNPANLFSPRDKLVSRGPDSFLRFALGGVTPGVSQGAQTRPSFAFIQPSTFLRLPYKYLRRVAEYVVPFATRDHRKSGSFSVPGVELHGHLCGPSYSKVTPAETS